MLVISLLLISFFMFASSIKIWAWQTLIFETQLSFFKKYGLNRMHMFLVGLVELTASLLLIASLMFSSPVLQLLAASALAFTSVGAIYFHLRFDTVKDAVPALLTLAFSASLVLWVV